MNDHPPALDVLVIGGGPAGLMAAEAAARAGARVVVADAMPSVGRKLLLAGKGGLNLTHGEAAAKFLSRYEDAAPALTPFIRDLDATALRAFAAELGVETFIGSSGRVFPADMKAAPLLRRWLHRLRGQGVQFLMRHRWVGWDDGQVAFEHADERVLRTPLATVLALGGGSWPKLGSDGRWVATLVNAGVAVEPLKPANCGFDCTWSEFFGARHAGAPLKAVAARCAGDDTMPEPRRGEFVMTATGVEGSLIYALSSRLRRALEAHGYAELLLDLLPDTPAATVARELARQPGKRSLSEQLRRAFGLTGLKVDLLRECLPRESLAAAGAVARALKSLPLRLTAMRPLAEAISSAGGVRFGALDEALMLKSRPGVFCAGEMLDWEAPTGGYLLTAAFATGAAAGRAAAAHAQAADKPAEPPAGHGGGNASPDLAL